MKYLTQQADSMFTQYACRVCMLLVFSKNSNSIILLSSHYIFGPVMANGSPQSQIAQISSETKVDIAEAFPVWMIRFPHGQMLQNQTEVEFTITNLCPLHFSYYDLHTHQHTDVSSQR